MISTIRSNFMAFISRLSDYSHRVNLLFLVSIALFLMVIFSFAHPVDHRLTTNQLTARFLSAMP